MSEKKDWDCRIDKEKIEYFNIKLEKGVLIGGWGYDEGLNLKKFVVDEGVSRNWC